MRKTLKHLEDEHMRLYEWSGAGAGCPVPARSKRTHPWHASYSVLAMMTSLLILSGCQSKSPAESASERRSGETNLKEGALYEEATPKPATEESPEAAGYALGAAPAEAPAR
ncbi:MAG: hypothetical protein KKG40_06290 [Gammaproteobacteria bacterium]|nr:hypothetical protein [Gammaproteobacteria bacterium]